MNESSLPRADVVGTLVFVVALAVTTPLRDERAAQYAIGIVSMVLFAIGVVFTLWSFFSAVERSRTEELSVAGVYFLAGGSATATARKTMMGCLAVQVVGGLAAAIVGAVGLGEDEVNALAFAVLVPMFGIGMNGMWAARYGSFGPRADPAMRPTNRKIR